MPTGNLKLKQASKFKTNPVRAGIKRSGVQFKFHLPIQDVSKSARDADRAAIQDFEPIIIEEVFYNGRFAVCELQNSMQSITP